MFSSTMSIKHAFAYQNQGLALEKMGIPVTRSLLVQNLTLLTNIDFFLKTWNCLCFKITYFVFLFIFFLFL